MNIEKGEKFLYGKFSKKLFVMKCLSFLWFLLLSLLLLNTSLENKRICFGLMECLYLLLSLFAPLWPLLVTTKKKNNLQSLTKWLRILTTTMLFEMERELKFIEEKLYLVIWSSFPMECKFQQTVFYIKQLMF